MTVINVLKQVFSNIALYASSSDTESADQGPAQKKNILKKKAKIPLTSMFKKAKDKVAGDTEILKVGIAAYLTSL